MNWIARYYDVDWVCTGEPGLRIDYAVHQHDVWTVHVEAVDHDEVAWAVRGFDRRVIASGSIATLHKVQEKRVAAAMKLGMRVLHEIKAERAEWVAQWDEDDCE